MEGLQCIGKKTDGTPCSAAPKKGSHYCFFHDPETPEACIEAGRKGGGKSRIASIKVLEDAPDVRLRTFEEITTLIEQTVNQVRTGKVSPVVSNAVCQLVTAALKIKDQTDIDKRMTRLEKALGEQGKRGNYGNQAA
jgi:hypothetical protein